MDGAARNLVAEVPDDHFDYYREQVRKQWNEELGRIEITTDDKDERAKFY
ncbi:glycoside hydrolase domain-containing protein, partial [Acinetobacter pittii]